MTKLVFGPSAEKRSLARTLVIREFPNCPICKGNSGYEVLGSSLNAFKCNTCQATWESSPLSNNTIVTLTLIQPSLYDFRGIELVGLSCFPSFYKSFDASYGNFLKSTRSQMTGQLGSKVSWKQTRSWYGSGQGRPGSEYPVLSSSW